MLPGRGSVRAGTATRGAEGRKSVPWRGLWRCHGAVRLGQRKGFAAGRLWRPAAVCAGSVEGLRRVRPVQSHSSAEPKEAPWTEKAERGRLQLCIAVSESQRLHSV